VGTRSTPPYMTILVSVVCAVLSACSDDKGVLVNNPDGTFDVHVVSGRTKSPVVGAVLRGGEDWDSYVSTTDANGIAILPPQAARWFPTITANNHFPQTELHQVRNEYQLQRTLLHLTQVATVNGSLILQRDGEFSMLDYGGRYDVYRVTADSVYLEHSAQLAPVARGHIVRNDTLWYATHDSGVFVYDISELRAPRKLMHLEIPGYLWSLCLQDSVLFVANPWDDDNVRAYTWTSSGEYRLVGSFGPKVIVRKLFIHKGVLFGQFNGAVTAWDISDPGHGVAVFHWSNPYASDWFQNGDSLVEVPQVSLGDEYFAYKVLDIHDPLSPVWNGELNSWGVMNGFLADSLAFGKYSDQDALLSRSSDPDSYYASAVVMPRYEPLLGDGFLASDRLVVLGGRAWRIDSKWPD